MLKTQPPRLITSVYPIFFRLSVLKRGVPKNLRLCSVSVRVLKHGVLKRV